MGISVPSPAAATGAGVSTWKTPLPYLFGGLAAMFLLISMSLLFLACSYWRYANRLERGDVESARRRVGQNGGESGEGVVKVAAAFKEKFAVIMPGDENPTCLATPRCYRGFDSDDEDEKQSTMKEKSSEETTSYLDEANPSYSEAVD